MLNNSEEEEVQKEEKHQAFECHGILLIPCPSSEQYGDYQVSGSCKKTVMWLSYYSTRRVWT